MSQYATASPHCAILAAVSQYATLPPEKIRTPMLKDLARWVRRSTKERANGKQSSPRREDYSPGRRKGLHWLAQIRTFAISQREEFSLFTSKIAVGPLIAERPPHRSERAQFGHSAPTSGV